MRISVDSAPPVLINVSTMDAMAATIPALPKSIRNCRMRRRTGWLTTFSDSPVVKPTPVKADRA